MGDADIQIGIAHGLIAQPAIKTLGRALSAQTQGVVAPLARRLRQSLHDLPTHPGAPQPPMNGHAPDLAYTGSAFQQAPSGNGLPQTVVGHGVQAGLIGSIPFFFSGDALLFDKHSGAYPLGIWAKLAP